ncbi:MAG: DNA-binding protein [Cohnella sp.]|nr:MAG: DNA-binding protein [Cohnella sp.]
MHYARIKVRRRSAMPVSEKNERIVITVTKELKKELEQFAKQDDRSLSNYVHKVLREHVEKLKGESD